AQRTVGVFRGDRDPHPRRHRDTDAIGVGDDADADRTRILQLLESLSDRALGDVEPASHFAIAETSVLAKHRHHGVVDRIGLDHRCARLPNHDSYLRMSSAMYVSMRSTPRTVASCSSTIATTSRRSRALNVMTISGLPKFIVTIVTFGSAANSRAT